MMVHSPAYCVAYGTLCQRCFCTHTEEVTAGTECLADAMRHVECRQHAWALLIRNCIMYDLLYATMYATLYAALYATA